MIKIVGCDTSDHVRLLAEITAYADKAKRVDDAAMVQPAISGKDWIMHGRDYSETRFSPLKRAGVAFRSGTQIKRSTGGYNAVYVIYER
jgi:hypothetical protein